MLKSKLFNKILDNLPATGQYFIANSFLTIDTNGRIIIEDCDKINTFTDELLIITQGKISLTFIGSRLKLVNLSRRGSQLTGSIDTIRLDRNGVK